MTGKKVRRATLALAGGMVAATAAGWLWSVRPHLVRTMGGLALVHTIRDGAGERVRVLRTGCVYQSATYLGARRMEPAFAYYRAFDRLFDLRPDARRVLVIGGGGFAFPKLVAARHPGVHTDVVEIDPAVIRLARRWFFFDEAVSLARASGGDLRVICGDGRSYLEGVTRPYDAVILDAFMGAEPVRSLATVEALRLVRRALVPDGICLMNVVSRDGGADVSFLRSEVATALVAFPCVEVALAMDEAHDAEDNYLLAASANRIGLPGAIPYDEGFLGGPLFDQQF